MPRSRVIIANWKMYKTSREAADYIERLAPAIEGCTTRVYLAVPYTSISSTAACARHFGIVVGAQNMNDARDGAFTGEVAALMLKEAGAQFVILGHSERRRFFGETDEFIQRKVLRAFQDDLSPVLCVGEQAADRENKKTHDVLKSQITCALKNVPEKDAGRLILAYEPVWAIGSGKIPVPRQMEETHAFCRKCLEEMFGKRKAGQIPIVYGGSVSPENAADLIQQKNIDGLLVGGASLDPEVLAKIVRGCEERG
jgi:triosephosphate isomerase